MKNIFNKFAFFIALSFVFISCGNLTTSENDDSIPQGKGKITISTDLKNHRSVLPTAIKVDTTGLKWELVGTKNGEPKTIKFWEDNNSVTAYKLMTSDSGIVIDTGTWDFTLTASNTAGKNVLSATISATINSGNNDLNFVMQEATGDTAATGSIEFTLNFPGNVVSKGIATLTPYEGTNSFTQEFTADEGTTNQFLSTIIYNKEDLSAGYYILKIELQQEKGDTTTPAVEYETINTYSCLIRVAPGLLSKGEYTLSNLAQLYTINYECNQGSFESQQITTSYNAYTSFALPTPTLTGYYFAGWYTREYADDGTFTENLFGNAGDTRTINADTTLYAKWNKEITGITHANNTLYISNYEGLCIFRDIVNGSHTADITIPANSGASDLVCNANTYYNYFNVELENDINVTDAWIPIGVYSSTSSESREYTSTFNGNNHTITLNNGIDSTSYAALFVNVKGTIKNLVVAGEINSRASNGVAGICAYSNGGIFEHCVNKCNISSNTSSGTGGIVGYSNGATIRSCVNMGVISSSLSTIGGIVGAASPSSNITIENSINLGKITGTSNVSGIFGLGGSSTSVPTITDCINIGEIAVTPGATNSLTYAAGIICSSESVRVTNCISVGNIINNTSDFTGTANFGAINYSSGKGAYSNCYYDSAKINSPNDSSATGITAKTTSELCNPDFNILSNWSKGTSRYPLPNIVATETLVGISESVWNEICTLATVDTSSSGGSGIVTNAVVSTFSDLKAEIESVTDTTIYTLENPYVIGITNSFETNLDTASTITVSSHVKLVATTQVGCTITKSAGLAAVNIFTVATGASLTLGDSKAVGELFIDGNGNQIATTKSLINVTGTLVLNENSYLQNNKCKEGYATNGAAVFSAGGTVKILGGTVKYNSNSYKNNTGGAIYIKNGTFEMTAGVVSHNSSYSSGGAIYVENSTVTISGGTFVNNEASIASGNGVYGGALYLSSCTVNITGATFSNNIATNTGTTTTNTEFYGGAIHVTGSGTNDAPAIISNCSFNYNTAYQRGGAIYTGGVSYININSSTFNSNTVTNDTANGSAVYIGNTDGNITIEGCTFNNNNNNTVYAVYNGSTGGIHTVDSNQLSQNSGYNSN